MLKSAEERQKIRMNWYLIAALVIACVTAWPLIAGGGLINTRGGGDSPFLLQRLHQLEQAVLDGHFPVRWMGDANYGYGYPFFNFYAPLAFYVALVYRLFGAGYVQAIQLSQLTAFVVAAWGAFSLAQRWYRRDWVALVVSAAYTTAPFHLVNVYVRGDSIAEFWAMSFYPLVILAADRLLLATTDRGRTRYSWINGIGWLGLAYGGLVLSHNISAMIFSPFVLLFVACRLAPSFKKGVGESAIGRLYGQLPQLGAIGAGLLLGVAVSAWFWLPALGEQELTSIGDMTVGYFNYRYGNGVHFRSADLVQPTLAFDPNVADGRAFRMGLVQALLTLAALGGLAWRPFGNGSVVKRLGWGISAFMVIGLLVATFMLNPLSIFLWDTLPLLPFTQFPWRFLSVQAFFTALLSGVPIFRLARAFGRSPAGNTPLRKRPWWLAGTLSGILAVGLVFVGISQLDLNFLPIPDSDVTAENLARYEWFTRNVGTTVSAEYLPPEAQPRSFTSPWLDAGERNEIKVLSGEASGTLISRKTARQMWQITVTGDEPAVVVFPTLFWEGWNALLNGDIWGGESAKLSGLIQVTVPPGSHEIALVLGRTRIRAIAEGISVSALVLTLVVFVTDTRRWQYRRALLRLAALPLLALSAVLVASAVAPTASPQDGSIYSQDFDQLGWLHPQPEILFESGVILKNVSLATQAVNAGDTLEMTLEWANLSAGGADRSVSGVIELFTPAGNVSDKAVAMAGASMPVQAGVTRYEIAIPPNAPAGLLSPRLTLSDGDRSLTATDEKRGRLFLQPVRIVARPSDGPTLVGLDVSVVDVTQPQPGLLRLHLAWHTDRPLVENLVASFRLTDANGQEVHAAQQDFQPGFGHQPTSAWRPNAPNFDVIGMKIPQPLPPNLEGPWTLLVFLYEPDDGLDDIGKTRLFRRLGTLSGPADQLTFSPAAPLAQLPLGVTTADVPLVNDSGEPVLALDGYRIDQADGGINVSLFWRATGQPAADYTHFVHLIDPATDLPVVQHDSMPSNYTWPTSQLTAGQIIEDKIFLPTGGVPAGRYVLRAGMYENLGDRFPRLVQPGGGDGVIGLGEIEIR